jgi:hypothetical protein
MGWRWDWGFGEDEEWGSGGVGEWVRGRVGEWGSGREGEGESGRGCQRDEIASAEPIECIIILSALLQLRLAMTVL